MELGGADFYFGLKSPLDQDKAGAWFRGCEKSKNEFARHGLTYSRFYTGQNIEHKNKADSNPGFHPLYSHIAGLQGGQTDFCLRKIKV
jgi:hypothetical protein